jgi:NADH-quinone oxidoreductase subunit D
MSVMDVSLGPQHPGSGHVRLLLRVDGDIIRSVDPDIGYVHRGVEKIAEYRNFVSNIPHLERPTIIDAIHLNWAYMRAVEELQGAELPERGLYVRTIAAEINRIHSHMYWMAIMAGIFSGHTTAFMWAFGDRELFLDLMEQLTGARLTYSFLVPGGVRRDIPKGFYERLLKTLEYLEDRLPQYDRMFFNNPIVKARTKGVGVLSKDEATKLGLVGPVLRASGVNYDVRRVEPYGVYDQMEFDIPVFDEGDCYSRFRARFMEWKQSIRILRQAIDRIPKGPIAVKAPLVAPRDEATGRVESSRGEISFFIVGQGSVKPYRVKMNPGSFRNLAAIPYLIRDIHIGDLPVVYGSLDYWPVEADR